MKDKNDYMALCARLKELARKYPNIDWMSIYLMGGSVKATNARIDKELKINHLA